RLPAVLRQRVDVPRRPALLLLAPTLHQVPLPQRLQHRVQVPVARRPEVAQLLLDFLLDVVAGLLAGGEQSEDRELGAVGGRHGVRGWRAEVRVSIGPTYIGPIYWSREMRGAPAGRGTDRGRGPGVPVQRGGGAGRRPTRRRRCRPASRRA